MSYLNDYLKVLPKVDRERVMEMIRGNEQLFAVENLSEEEFQLLITRLAEEETQRTSLVDLTEKVEAAPLNTFFSNTSYDLIKLFQGQNMIEGAARNYDRIYKGNLEDLSRAIDALERRVRDLDLQNKIDAEVIVKSYDFTEEERKSNFESWSSETAYLYEDRDGKIAGEVELTRDFHKHYGALGRTKRLNRLINEKGQTTAQAKLVYTSPYVMNMNNPVYAIDKAVDDSDETFWAVVGLAPEETTDRVKKNP